MTGSGSAGRPGPARIRNGGSNFGGRAGSGWHSADRAALLLVSGLAARASARPGIARAERGDARGGFFAAVAPAEGHPVTSPVGCDLLSFPDDGEPHRVDRADDAPHNPDCKSQTRHSVGAAPIREIKARSLTQRLERDVTGHSRGRRPSPSVPVRARAQIRPYVSRGDSAKSGWSISAAAHEALGLPKEETRQMTEHTDCPPPGVAGGP